MGLFLLLLLFFFFLYGTLKGFLHSGPLTPALVTSGQTLDDEGQLLYPRVHKIIQTSRS